MATTPQLIFGPDLVRTGRPVLLPPIPKIKGPTPFAPVGADNPLFPLQTGPQQVNPELKRASEKQQLHDTIKSTLIFAAAAEALGATLFPKAPKSAQVIAEQGAGFELEPVKGSKRAGVRVGRATAIGFALPAPFGFTPPEFFGLRPDFLLTPEERRQTPSEQTTKVEIISALGGNPGGVRRDLADAIEADRERDAYKRLVPFITTAQLRRDLINPLIVDAYGNLRVVRPAEIREIAVAELQRRGQLTLSIPTQNIFVMAEGTVVPSKIVPVNAAAIANKDAAKGVNKELVSEIADP